MILPYCILFTNVSRTHQRSGSTPSVPGTCKSTHASLFCSGLYSNLTRRDLLQEYCSCREGKLMNSGILVPPNWTLILSSLAPSQFDPLLKKAWQVYSPFGSPRGQHGSPSSFNQTRHIGRYITSNDPRGYMCVRFLSSPQVTPTDHALAPCKIFDSTPPRSFFINSLIFSLPPSLDMSIHLTANGS